MEKMNNIRFVEFGSNELKKYISKSTKNAFLVTNSALIVIFLSFNFFFSFLKEIEFEAPFKDEITDIEPIKIDYGGGGEPRKNPSSPTKISKTLNPLTSNNVPQAIDRVVVKDSIINDDLINKITIDDELGKESLTDLLPKGNGSAKGNPLGNGLGNGSGNGSGNGNGNTNSNGGNENLVDILPDIKDFVVVEKAPKVDISQLQKLIEYPNLALKSGTQGKVIVKVLVSKTGEILKKKIIYSDSQLLDNAALEAINKYGKFEPAVQNGQNVACWVAVPINFKLRN